VELQQVGVSPLQALVLLREEPLLVLPLVVLPADAEQLVLLARPLLLRVKLAGRPTMMG
jgi:hypothetical protein